jgi:hypothetical protein
MSRCVRAVVVAGVLLFLAVPALGHGGWPVVATASYYCPVYYSPVVPVGVVYARPVYVTPAPLICPVPRLLISPYAVPTPAPPSQTPEPPRKTAPKVTETRALSGPAVAAGKDPSCCQVGFWNVTGRDVMLTVDGQTRTLPRNQSLTMRVGRQLTWQVDQRPPQAENVPADKRTMEIVIRQ